MAHFARAFFGVHMEYNISYMVAAMLIVGIMFTFRSTNRELAGRANKVYKTLLVMVFFSAFFNLITCFMLKNPQPSRAMLLTWLLVFYYVVETTLTPLFFQYIASLCGVTGDSSRTVRLFHMLGIIPYIVGLVCVLMTPATGWVFFLRINGIYERGPALPLLYAISFMYAIHAIVMVIRHRKRLTLRAQVSVSLFIVCSISAAIFQIIVPKYQVTEFAMALCCLIMYFILENPDKTIDNETGLFNKEAFYVSLSEAMKRKKAFFCIAVSVDDSRYLSEIYGYTAFVGMLRQISIYLESLSVSGAFRISENYLAVPFYNEDANCRDILERLMSRFKETWTISSSEVVCKISSCAVYYPSVVTTSDEMLEGISHYLAMSRKGGIPIVPQGALPSKSARILELEQQSIQLLRESEEAKKAMLEAEAADRAKSVFLANMSHEIRTPMNAILGMTNLIQNENISDRVRGYTDDILNAGTSLVSLINDILDFSKIESGKMELVDVEYSLSKVLYDSISIVAPKFDGGAVNLLVVMDRDIPDRLYGDELRLKQIMINLINNAAKFTQEGYVRLVMRSNYEGADDLELRIDIEDTGCGIKPEELGKLFESFSRMDEKLNRNIEGSGLGLAISRRLAQLMDGDISVDSVYGGGSTFHVVVRQRIIDPQSRMVDFERISAFRACLIGEQNDALSRALEDLRVFSDRFADDEDVDFEYATTEYTHIFTTKDIYLEHQRELVGDAKLVIMARLGEQYDDVPEVMLLRQPVFMLSVARIMLHDESDEVDENSYIGFSAKGARVLAVDDNPVNLKVVSGLLTIYDIDCVTAASGKECLEILKERSFDLIFMDHMMPEMDGIETLRRIRNSKDTRLSSVPVVALTANAIDGMREMFLANGFEDFLSKPIVTEHLEEVLRTYLAEFVTDREALGNGSVSDEKTAAVIEGLKNFGIDTETGITNCGGVPSAYMEVLKTTFECGPEKLAAIKSSFEDRNFDAYRIEVHALKSVAASIGALELSAMAKQHEFAAKDGDTGFIESDEAQLVSEYEKLIDELSKYCTEDENEGNTGDIPIGANEFNEKIDAIRAAIDDFDDERALDGLANMMKYKLSDEEYEKIKGAHAKIGQYDYDEALERLKGIERQD